MRARKLFIVLLVLAFLVSVGSVQTGIVRAAGSFGLSKTRLIFGYPKGTTSPAQVITVSNNTGSAITVTLTMKGVDPSQFDVNGGASASINLNPSQSQNVNVRFKPSSVGIKTALLEAKSGSDIENITLRGLGANGEGGNNEPSFQRVMEVFEFNIRSNDNNPANTNYHDTAGGTALQTGDEIPMQVMEKAGPGAVTFQLLAAYAIDGNPPARVGWYPAGTPGTRNEVFSLKQGEEQMVNPGYNSGVGMQFDPGDQVFGLYTTFVPPRWNNRHVYSEDALNAPFELNAAYRHKVRFFPLKDANGVIEPFAFVATWEECEAQGTTSSNCGANGYDYNDVIVIVRNVKPVGAGEASSEALPRFYNLDWGAFIQTGTPNADWMHTWLVMNHAGHRVNENHKFHNTAWLRIFNDGATPLEISNLTIANPSWFRLVNDETSLNIAPGTFYDLAVRLVDNTYNEVTLYYKRDSTLTLATNVGDYTINLRGAYQVFPEGDEMKLPMIAQIFGFSSNICSNPGGSWVQCGEEVLSRYWRAADTNKPIFVRQLVALHGCCETGTAANITFDFSSNDVTLKHAATYGQSYFPGATSADAPYGDIVGAGPTEAGIMRSDQFQLNIHGKTSCASACTNQHGVRWWPARSPNNGWLIPNTYIVSMDYVGGGANYDYNDNMYIVSNVRPVSLPGSTNTQPNLKLEAIEAKPSPARQGGNFTLKFTIRNATIFAASNVKLNVNVPANMNVVSAPGCSGSPTLVCDVPNFQGGDLRYFDLVFSTNQLGDFNFTSNVTTTTTETSTADNSRNILVTVLPQTAPVAQNDSYDATQGALLTVNKANGVLKNDTDANLDPLTAVLVSGPGNAASFNLKPNGSFTYQPNPAFVGVDTFTYRANDGTDDSNLATVSINVIRDNKPPVAGNDSYVVAEDTTLTVNAANGLKANDSDQNGDPLTITLVTQPSHVTSFTLNQDGSFTYVPASNFNGTEIFTYKLNDGFADSNIATVTIEVTPVTDVPVANDDSYFVLVNETLNINAANGVLANDSDGDNDPLTAILVSNVSKGTLNLKPTGGFVYTPNAGLGDNETDSFTYKANDGTNDSDVATVTIHINPTNKPPVAVNDSYKATRDVQLIIGAAQGVLANDSDPEGGALTAELVNKPDGVDLNLFADGGFAYTPASGFEGKITFTYRVKDNQNATAIALATINVLAGAELPNDLVYNGGFEVKDTLSGPLPAGWTTSGIVSDRVKCFKEKKPNKIFAYSGDCAFQFVGNPNKLTLIAQRPNVSPVEVGDTLRLSVFAKGKKLQKNRGLAVAVVQYQESGIPKQKIKIKLPKGTFDYTAFVKELVVEHEVSLIKVRVVYRGRRGVLLVDNVSLLVVKPDQLDAFYAPSANGVEIPTAPTAPDGSLPLPPAAGTGESN